MGDNEMKYKQLSIIILLCCIIASCTTRNDIVKLIYNEWISHDEQAFVFDFSKSMDFDWDVMCIYSAKCSLEFIERDLGAPYSDFVDTGERVIFLKNKRIVYSQAWYFVRQFGIRICLEKLQLPSLFNAHGQCLWLILEETVCSQCCTEIHEEVMYGAMA